tara:strand:+ start:79 stop:321 length:243 start_codon:yes stop_codon:yes gene_type:complete
MRSKTAQDRGDSFGKTALDRDVTDQYGFKTLSAEVDKKRLDVNDLLKKVAEEKRKSTKTNILIFSTAAFVVFTILFITSF